MVVGSASTLKSENTIRLEADTFRKFDNDDPGAGQRCEFPKGSGSLAEKDVQIISRDNEALAYLGGVAA
jgi:hypothetical protein